MRGMDVAVLGGGPAGLAAALALRQRGCRVAVYDAQRPPVDKACGEGLMPHSVRILTELGISLDHRDGANLAGISFHDAARTARCEFREGYGLGVRRTRLHARLVARAQEAGIALHWGAGVHAGESGFSSAGVPVTMPAR